MLALAIVVLLPQGPLDFGRQRLEKALGAGAAAVTTEVVPGGVAESFKIVCQGGRARVTAPDASGAMYGALELCERGLGDGEVRAEPFLRDRGWNVFLTLPWDYEKSVTDYDEKALVDPERWWFQSEDYWDTLLDQMAASRLNWLDLHGMWDVDVTDAPNLYAYFVASERYPEVGPSAATKAKCFERLKWVIEKAHARGVRVSLMSYEARFTTPHRKQVPYRGTEKEVYDYTREVVAKLIKELPGLDAIGFRIGESGRGEQFFQCYLDAVKDSGRDIPLLTRSWLARKSKVVPLARAAKDFTVEIKYNGEQWGPPYMVAGGRMAGWYSYSFEDYLSDSGGPAKWPGNPAENGERWPDQPYKIVWQVRCNGTHRVFSFYEPEWVRRSVACMKIGTASGFSVEPLNCFYPAETRYLIAKPEDRWCKWIHQRDELFLMQWGRMGYDPKTPIGVFEKWFTARFGAKGKQLAEDWLYASRAVPKAFTAFSLGPDHRNHAPELEWGGTTEQWLDHEPFDSHSYCPLRESLAYVATGGRDGRVPIRRAMGFIPTVRGSAETEQPLRYFQDNVSLLAALGWYYEARFMAAWTMFVWAKDAKQDLERALAAWQYLSDSPAASAIRPFTEKLRMHTGRFHWRDELSRVSADAAEHGVSAATKEELTTYQGPITDGGWINYGKGAELRWETRGKEVVVWIDGAVNSASLLVKPLPSSTYFHRVPMRLNEEGKWEARFRREDSGHLLAAEAERWALIRLPHPAASTPYLVVPSRQAATPTYYSSEEALTYLKPESLSPDKHGTILLAPRSWNFHRRFDVSTQRKLLDPVERGMTLLVLQQDYVTPGRYPMAWLPKPLRAEGHKDRVFEPAGALGLSRIETDDILWQRFLPSDGWEVLGNGGVAHMTYGKGHIWMVQARVMQRMHIPDCARAMKTLIELGGKTKPVVIVDAGSEGAEFTTSVWPDFMNAHDVPFLTLGEVIANEQGMDSVTPVPGKVLPDAILNGKGAAMVKALYDQKVKAAAHREGLPPKTAHKELMRCLGLDPLPERTPLNARITGTLKRDGYRVEKIAFESRPGFTVTANLYLPAKLEGKAPVIVNPHGHWPHKKQEPVVQSRLIAQALHGYVALILDSPGFSFEGDNVVERREAGTHDDLRLILATNTTGIYVWDLMRALDYLETRPECDTTKVGITGASGGGLAAVYAFAADARFTCAVPVVYATSLEVNPNNGCLCNHVPGTLQIGDRADVLAIRAPAPVLVIGATSDREFPPAGTELTGKKLQALWRLLGAEDRVGWKVFPGPHDYNQAMRELAMGFFDRHLRGVGDGAPVPEPKLAPEPAGSPALLVLDAPPKDALTMRRIAEEMLQKAPALPFAEVARINGGVPAFPEPKLGYVDDGRRPRMRCVTIPSENGLVIPGVLWLPEGEPKECAVLVDEGGKSAAAKSFDVPGLVERGIACLCIDVRGYGELPGLDARLMTYLGTGMPFAMGFDAACAARAALTICKNVSVRGRGRTGAQVALFAKCLEPRIAKAVELEGLRELDECFRADVPTSALQPRAALGVRLEALR